MTTVKGASEAKLCVAGSGGVGKSVLIKSINERVRHLQGLTKLKISVGENVDENGVSSYYLEKPEEDPDNEFGHLQELWVSMTSVKPTVFDQYVMKMTHGDMEFEIVMVDTAGQKEYNMINRNQYQDTKLYILVIDCTNDASLEECESTIQTIIQNYCGTKKKKKDDLHFLCVRTKIDMINKQFAVGEPLYKEQVTELEISKVLENLKLSNYQVISCSGLTQDHIDEVIHLIGEMVSKGSTKSKKPSKKCSKS